MHSHRVIAIVGPTASGKSAVAERLAERFGTEVISADSMQVYRGMDIGTAKTPPNRRRAPHRCVDLVDPGTPYSAALFQRDARTAIDAVHARGLPAVLAGGTGLYVRAALDVMAFPGGALATETRAALDTRAADDGPALHAELARIDPASAALIHPNNVRRVVRALEMAAQGVSYAEQSAGFSSRRYHYAGTVTIGLTMDRPALYERIDARVDEMVAAGLLGEVRALLDAGFRDALTAAQAIGYKEFVPVIEGGTPLEVAISAVKQATRRYAKRQLTWFRADPRITWADVTGLSPDGAFEVVADLLESAQPAEGG